MEHARLRWGQGTDQVQSQALTHAGAGEAQANLFWGRSWESVPGYEVQKYSLTAT